MNSTLQKTSFDDCYCFHCCCCCCYHSQRKRLQQKQKRLNDSIPYWKTPITNSQLSFCSCSSSINEADDIRQSSSFPSTQCTTPVDLILKEDQIITPDAEKLAKKKLHAIEELLQTERDYVKDLTYLVHVCLDILSRQQWIIPEHLSTIARNSKDILNFHKQFLIYYDTGLYDNHSSFLATVFLDQIQQFSLYKNYCDLHADAWALTSEYRDKPEWSYFVRDCAVADSYTIPLSPIDNSYQQQQKKLLFEDYLIKPVQRICRYQLLIKEIIRYTSSQTTEYDLWNVVLEKMQDIVTEIDNLKLQRDIQERTDRFIDRLEGDWRISKELVSQLGNLLIAGAIEVTYSALGQTVSKPRYLGCIVFPTYIIMVRPKKVTTYEPKHWFPLRMADFEDLKDDGQKEHSFVVRCKKHTFAFSASCSQEKQLWVKKIQEALAASRTEASDENMSAQDFIVPSLPGVTSKRSPQRLRLSRSFTNILDMTIVGTSTNQPMNTMERKQLRRSASATINFEDILQLHPAVALKKRYSADYSSFKKTRNSSETYLKSDPFMPRRRPSSLDLLSGNNKMIGKFKNNHQNALRVAVDHKLRDVCTQDYLSSRAWHARERDQSSFSFESSITTLNRSSSGGSPDILKKRKSSSFIRSSASSFSIIIPKRASESKQSNSRAQNQLAQHTQPECDVDSNLSSCSSSISNTKYEKADTRRVSQSTQHVLSQRFISESPESFGSEQTITEKPLERSPSKRKIFVGKVLRRIASLHQKYPPSTSFGNSYEELTVKKAASVGAKRNTKKWMKHEELTQLGINDLPIQKDEETTTTIKAFAYASTPPPSSARLKKNDKWRKRLSLIRPASFLKPSGNDNT